MSTLAKNVSQVVLYENQVSDFVALLWMQTPLGHWIIVHVKKDKSIVDSLYGEYMEKKRASLKESKVPKVDAGRCFQSAKSPHIKH